MSYEIVKVEKTGGVTITEGIHDRSYCLSITVIDLEHEAEVYSDQLYGGLEYIQDNTFEGMLADHDIEIDTDLTYLENNDDTIIDNTAKVIRLRCHIDDFSTFDVLWYGSVYVKYNNIKSDYFIGVLFSRFGVNNYIMCIDIIEDSGDMTLQRKYDITEVIIYDGENTYIKENNYSQEVFISGKNYGYLYLVANFKDPIDTEKYIITILDNVVNAELRQYVYFINKYVDGKTVYYLWSTNKPSNSVYLIIALNIIIDNNYILSWYYKDSNDISRYGSTALKSSDRLTNDSEINAIKNSTNTDGNKPNIDGLYLYKITTPNSLSKNFTEMWLTGEHLLTDNGVFNIYHIFNTTL